VLPKKQLACDRHATGKLWESCTAARATSLHWFATDSQLLLAAFSSQFDFKVLLWFVLKGLGVATAKNQNRDVFFRTDA